MKRLAGMSSIRHKLILAFVTVIVLIAALGGIQAMLFYGYLQENNSLIEGIARANRLSGVLKPALDHEIRDIVNGMKTFEEGKPYELIEEMNARLAELERSENSPDVRTRMTEIRNTMGSLHVQIDTLQDQLNSGVSVDQQSVTLDLTVDTTSLIEQSVQELVREKLHVMEAKTSTMTRSFANTNYMLAGAAFAVIAASLLIAWLISRTIAHPLSRIQQSLTRLSEGDLAIERIPVRSRDEIGKLCHAFHSTLTSLQVIVASVRETSRHVHDASEHIHNGVRENNQAGEEIAVATQSISEALAAQDGLIQASAEQFNILNGSLRILLRNSEVINHKADESVNLANGGYDNMNAFMQSFKLLEQTVTAVEQDTALLDERMGEMADLLRQIRNIASETNILSLNASIEAARANQSGTSFAVIAQRIKQLAGQTDSLASTVDMHMNAVRENVSSIRVRMTESMEQLSSGEQRAALANQAYTAIREANVHVQDAVQAASRDLQQAEHRMNTAHARMDDARTQAGRITEAVAGIAAMGEEQVASLQEVSATSDLLMNRIRDMERSIAKFQD